MDRKTYVPFLLIAMLLLAACNTISSVSAKPLTNEENTQQAATATALIATPTPSQAPTAIQAPTLLPTQTATQVPSPQPTQVFSPTATQQNCDTAGFVGDVTIPDNSMINPEDTFTKTWQLKNNSSCVWDSSYTLVFTGGDLISGPTSIAIPAVVNPGGTVDVSVNLIAPTVAGTYQENWMLRDANGLVFGVGPNGNQPIWVKIVVNSPAQFAVTGVNSSVVPVSYTGGCPVSIAFYAIITANDVGTVTYYWQHSDGSVTPEGTITFTAAGSQTIEDSWMVGAPGESINGWDQIYIDAPNHQFFDQTTFGVICDAPTATQQPTATVTATPTQPAPSATPTQPAPSPRPNQPAPSQTATQPTPSSTPTQPAPSPTPTQPAPTPTTAVVPPTPTPTP